jgi:hypothetical protein
MPAISAYRLAEPLPAESGPMVEPDRADEFLLGVVIVFPFLLLAVLPSVVVARSMK